jgi:hypothetical protein
MKNIKLVVTTAVFATLLSCVNGDDYGTPDLSNDCVTIAKTKEVSDITNIATATTVQYTTGENIDYIEAYVTSSDEGGNFYKSISMMSLDGLKGFSMPVDNYNLYTEFEPGRKVTIKLDKNRYYNKQYGSTVLGSSYNGGVGRVSGVEYKDVILRSCENVNENDIVKDLTITAAKNDQYLNMLMEFDGVQFTDVSLGKKYYDPTVNNIGGATNHTITDVDGNTIILRVSEFAVFANNAIPSYNGKIRGVLTKYNSDYQFMIRTINDVNLTNARLNPALENFESYATNTFVFPNYFNIKVLGTNDWFVGSFSGNKYLQARKGSSSGATKIFLVMPYNFDIHTRVSFKTLYGYMSQTSSPIMKVYYSTNFNSSNPTANLVDITSSFTFSNHTGTGWASTFTNSGIHTFTGMSGQGHIIFAYDVATTSTTNAETRPGTQIDNILFQ